jgi:hypothetical protein
MYFALLVGPTAGLLVLRALFLMSLDASAETLSRGGLILALFGVGMMWAVVFYTALAWLAIWMLLPPAAMWNRLRRTAKFNQLSHGTTEKQWVIWWLVGCVIAIATALAITRQLWMQP